MTPAAQRLLVAWDVLEDQGAHVERFDVRYLSPGAIAALRSNAEGRLRALADAWTPGPTPLERPARETARPTPAELVERLVGVVARAMEPEPVRPPARLRLAARSIA